MKSVFFQKEHEMLQAMCRGDICLNKEEEKGEVNLNATHPQYTILNSERKRGDGL